MKPADPTGGVRAAVRSDDHLHDSAARTSSGTRPGRPAPQENTVSKSSAIAGGLLAFGVGMLVGSAINDNDDYYPHYGPGAVYYGPRPFYPPAYVYRPVYGPAFRPAVRVRATGRLSQPLQQPDQRRHQQQQLLQSLLEPEQHSRQRPAERHRGEPRGDSRATRGAGRTGRGSRRMPGRAPGARRTGTPARTTGRLTLPTARSRRLTATGRRSGIRRPPHNDPQRARRRSHAAASDLTM